MNKKIITVILIGVFIFAGCNLKNPTTTNNQTPETVEFQDKIIAGTESAFYEISVTSTSTASTKLPINFNAQKNFVRFEEFLSSKSKFLFVVKPSVFEYLYIANLDGSGIKNLTEGLGYENILVFAISPDENWILIEALRSGANHFYISSVDGSKRYSVGRSDLIWFPHFSKDSSKVIFGKDRSGGLAQIGALDLNTGESNDILNEFKIKGSPQAVEFLNNSKILFAVGPSLYILDNGKLTTIPVPDSNFVWSFKVLSSGKVLCESNNNQNGVSIYLYDETLSKEPVKLFELKDMFELNSMLDYPEGKEFLGVYGGADNKSDNLYLFDEKNEKILNLTQDLPKGSVLDFCLSGDKSTVFFVHKQGDIQTVYSVTATGTNLLKLKEFDKSLKDYGIVLYPFKDSKNLLVSATYISEGPNEHKYDFKLYLIDTIKRSSIESSDCEEPLAYVKAISPSENTILISLQKLFTMNSMKCNNLSDIVGEKVIDAIYFPN